MTLIEPDSQNNSGPLNILVDSNAFVARMDEKDTNHNSVISIPRKSPAGSQLYTTSQIVSESLTVTSQKLGKATARELLTEFVSGSL